MRNLVLQAHPQHPLLALPGWVSPFATTPPTYAPAFDVKSTNAGLVVIADVPGVAEDELEVWAELNRLVVKGARGTKEDSNGVKYHARERMHGSFVRTFRKSAGRKH